MVDRNLTEIVIIADRSGSMARVASEFSTAIDTFVKEQQKLPGNLRISLAQFDNQYDLVYDRSSYWDGYKLIPRGGTALLDAVGRTITEYGAKLSREREGNRPGLVLFLIVTDGFENASSIYSPATISNMVKTQEDVYNWRFTFLGAGKDVFEQSKEINLSSGGSSYTNITNAITGTLDKFSRVRTSYTTRGFVSKADNEYTEEELKTTQEA